MADEKPYFIEQDDKGRYRITKGGARRASAIEDTQKKAIDRAKGFDPDRPILVERVRNTEVGKRDKWRTP